MRSKNTRKIVALETFLALLIRKCSNVTGQEMDARHLGRQSKQENFQENDEFCVIKVYF